MNEVMEVHSHQDANIYSHLHKNRFHLEQRIYKLSVNHLKNTGFLMTTFMTTTTIRENIIASIRSI